MLPGRHPLILPYAGVEPRFASAPRACAAGSAVLGRVVAGAGLVLGAFATIRADGETVTIGENACFGEGATVHIAQDRLPTLVGDNVTVGRNAVVHACTVGDDCVIGDDVVILDASEIGRGVVIEPGSTVYPRSRLDPHGHYAGSPAVLVGPVDESDRASRAASIRRAAGGAAHVSRERDGSTFPADAHFVAATARLAGRIDLAPGASVFFGCRLAAAALAVGRNANIQDNCVIETAGEVAIGCDTTLGHNVRMASGRIGDRSLVGIGAVLADRTVVEDDVLVAAGATTVEGQVLGSGWLWGGRPATPLKRLDEARRAMMAGTVRHYVGYGRDYRSAQIAAGGGRSP